MRMITTAAVAGSVLAVGLLAPVAASATPQPQYCLPGQYCVQPPYHDHDHDHDGGYHWGDHDHRGDRW